MLVSSILLLFIAVNGNPVHWIKVAGTEVDMRPSTVKEAVDKSSENQFHKEVREIKALTPEEKESITEQDVIDAFRTIPDLSDGELDVIKASDIRNYLVFHGVATKVQLQEFVSSPAILNTLRVLYTNVLQRPPEKPLDAVGLVVWGTILYQMGVKPDVVRAIDNRLRQSDEYRGLKVVQDRKP